MSLSTWLAFFAASWAISFSPGPGAVSAMASGLKYGFRRGYWTTVGLILGILAQFCIVAVGLGAVLAASELAFNLLKWLGAGYLVYLGWLQFRTDAAPVAVEAAPREDFSIRQLVMRGCMVNLINPKGTVFLLAVVPQFLNPAAPLAVQYVILAATLAFTDLVAMGCYTTLASRILRLLRTPRHIRWVNRAFGAMFILAGTVLATFSRRV
ncbi:LysE family transporter [Achromobacter sp. F4_2707]|uniref:LysE family transporter n=1 Tax=Achromobacter sp. F4_2707 TaxID=3114286 RepID=UPI0039C6CF5A